MLLRPPVTFADRHLGLCKQGLERVPGERHPPFQRHLAGSNLRVDRGLRLLVIPVDLAQFVQ